MQLNNNNINTISSFHNDFSDYCNNQIFLITFGLA